MDVKTTWMFIAVFLLVLIGHSPESCLFSEFEISDYILSHTMGGLFSKSWIILWFWNSEDTSLEAKFRVFMYDIHKEM